MNVADNEADRLVPLSEAVKLFVPGTLNPATVWRWATRGLSPAVDGDTRIRLAVTYCGRRPFTSKSAIDDFFRRATEARLARIAARSGRALGVDDSDLRSAGLLRD